MSAPAPVKAPQHVQQLLSELHQISLQQEDAISNQGRTSSSQILDDLKARDPSLDLKAAFDRLMRDKFIALDEDKCKFVYQLICAMGATNVVEAGTSYGVSTIYLALAVAEAKAATGKSGVVIATENEKGKALLAREHWAMCGPEVEQQIDLREGDLRETLKTGLPDIDLLLLDIWSALSLPTLKLVQPRLRPGAVVLTDNTISGAEGYADLLAYLRASENGFLIFGAPRIHALHNTMRFLDRSELRLTAILLAAFMINFTACGLLFAFGVYQSRYEVLALEDHTAFTGASLAEIDLIGTLSVSLMTILAPFVVAWSKHFRPQLVVCTGGILFGLANVLASFGHALWHFQLSQGLLLGIGTCLSFMPSMTVTAGWFDKQRGVAMGIVSAGTGIGGLIWAPVVTTCIDRLGFRNTLRLTGALAAALICAAGSVLSWEPTIASSLRSSSSAVFGAKGLFKVPLPRRELVVQPRFIAQALGAAFQCAVYYTPVFFMVSYAKTLGYSDQQGANLTALSNACNAIGKIAVGFIADRLGRLNTFFFVTAISASATLGLWVPSTLLGADKEDTSLSLFIAYTVLYGLFASAYISLFTPALVELFGAQDLPDVSGVMYMTQGMASLVGTPLAGVLVRGQGDSNDPSNYSHMAIFVGALMAAATLAVAWVRLEAINDRKGSEQKRTWKA
ncbi:hypothetical protein KCU83_g8087, partial [Aureobasidium melanogenum]